MAINPSLFNPGVYQVNRGENPPPGSPLPDPNAAPASTDKKRYVQVPDGNGGFYYYLADSQQGQDLLLQQSPGVNVVELPAAWNVGNGYHDGASQPTAPAAASGTPPAAAPAPAPTGAPVVNNGPPAGTGGSANSSDPATRGLYVDDAGTQPAKGRWIRIDGYADPTKGGDQLGVDLVREDSVAGQQWLQDHKGQQPVYVQTGFKTVATGGVAPIDVPEALAGSQAFQGLIQNYPTMGSNLLDAKEVPVPTEAGTGYSKAYSVTWLTPNGAKQTITFGVTSGDSSSGGTSTHVGVIGTSLETSGMKTPDQEALTRAQTQQAQAQTALDQARATGEGIDQAIKAKAQADRDVNNTAGLGNVTSVEASENGLRHFQGQLTQAQTANTAQQTASAAMGTVNQTYTNILQYYRDQGIDEAKAIELTQQYFNNKALVDNNNNTTALGAARAQVDAETAANTQRVSLANNRLSQSSQGFTEDAKTANDLNQYLKPGSSKGGDAFMALQAMRMANAKKYGSFDVNDSDLKFDPLHLPNGIRAFANPSAPSFVTYPDLPSMRNEAQTTGDRMGIHNRSAPPGLDTIPKSVVPTPAPAPASAPNTGRPATPAAPAAPTPQNYPRAASPAPVGAPPAPITAQQATDYNNRGINPATGEPNGQGQQLPPGAQGSNPSINPVTGEPTGLAPLPNTQPDGNEQPTDVLTLTSHRETDGQPATRQISRAEWDQQLAAHPELKASYDKGEITVDNAESGDNYVRLDNGSYVRKPSQGSPDAGANDALKVSLNQSTNDAVMAKQPTDQATDQQPTQASIFDRPTTPSRPPMTAEEMARAQQVMASYGQTPPPVPQAVSQLTGPSPALASTNAALGDPNLELQRRRQRAPAQMFGLPDSIYGLMDGAYPQYPSFFA